MRFWNQSQNHNNERTPMPLMDPVELPYETPIRVLVVESNENEARLLSEILLDTREAFFRPVFVRSLAEMKQIVARMSFDVALVDMALPDSNGLETVRRARKCACDAPIVVLGSHDDPQAGIEAVRLGAEDFHCSNDLDGRTLIRSLRFAIERHRMHQIHALTRLLSSLEDTPVADPLARYGEAAAGV
ncbi:MAG: response regulator [Bryobacteraceae bacterium]